MPNTSVFTGADGSLTLSAPTSTSAPLSTEGEKAQEVLDFFATTTIGRVHNVRVEVQSEVKAFNEIGQRYAAELRPGNVTVRGTIGRAYINGTMLNLLLGQEAASSAPPASWAQPAFNITLLVENAAAEGISNTVTIHEAKIDTWVYDMPEDDFLMESVSFKARYLTVADQG